MSRNRSPQSKSKKQISQNRTRDKSTVSNLEAQTNCKFTRVPRTNVQSPARSPFINFFREYRNKHQSMPIVQMVTAVSKIWTKLSTKQKKMYISKKVVKHANVVPTPRSIRKNHTLRKMNSLLRKPWQRSTPILRDVESFTGTSSSQDSSYLKSGEV